MAEIGTRSPTADRARPAVDAQIAVLDARLDALEAAVGEKRKPSARERFIAWAGVIGLCISIATGGFTLVDRLLVQPQTDALESFRSAVRQITEINRDLQTRAAQAKTPAEAAAIGTSGNLQKWRLLAQAEAALPRMKKEANAQEYYVLALEEVTVNRFDKAMDFGARAEKLARADGDKTQLSEILRIEAQLVSMAQGPTGLQTARRLFQEARDQLTSSQTFGASSMRARTAGDAAVLEAFWGDCTRIPPILADYARERDRPDVLPATRMMLQQNLIAQFGNQKRCAVELPSLPS